MAILRATRYNPELGEIIQRDSVAMRIGNDILKTVVFVGHETADRDGEVRFQPSGTAFFLGFDGYSHLVTARHVAKQLEPGPFVLRAKSKISEAAQVDIDTLGWIYHPDESVDVAAIPAGLEEPADWFKIGEDLILEQGLREKLNIGIGDEVQVVGLYRLLPGMQTNLPVVHTGHIAMMPGDEPIPVKDSTTGKMTYTNGYLVEMQTLEGLSGSPVFARFTWLWKMGDNVAAMSGPIRFLGLWQGSWGAPPDTTLAAQRPDALRAPVGMGIVVPADKIIETLALPKMAAIRDKHRRETDEGRAASMDSTPPTTADNPSHAEDFNRLLTSVTTGKPQDDQT